MQVLDFPGNPIGTIDGDLFLQKNLLNLQEIVLSNCNVSIVQQHAFRGLSNLDKLDLRHNRLTEVPSWSFASVPQLRELQLSGNLLGWLKDRAFTGLTQLTRLELSGCDIATVDTGAFAGLANLRWLKLDNNRLAELHPGALQPLRHNLHEVDLHHNPWNCTCNLAPVRKWMMDHNVPSTQSPACQDPHRLSGKLWEGLDLAEFACHPRIILAGPIGGGHAHHQDHGRGIVVPGGAGGSSSSPGYYHPSPPKTEVLGHERGGRVVVPALDDLRLVAASAPPQSQNVTLLCRVAASPEPEIEWTWQGHLIRNGSLGRVGSTVFTLSEQRAEVLAGSSHGAKEVLKESVLSILFADVDHGGEYTCTGLNRAGVVTVRIPLLLSKPVSTISGVQQQDGGALPASGTSGAPKRRNSGSSSAAVGIDDTSKADDGQLQQFGTGVHDNAGNASEAMYLLAAFAGGGLVFAVFSAACCVLHIRRGHNHYVGARLGNGQGHGQGNGQGNGHRDGLGNGPGDLNTDRGSSYLSRRTMPMDLRPGHNDSSYLRFNSLLASDRSLVEEQVALRVIAPPSAAPSIESLSAASSAAIVDHSVPIDDDHQDRANTPPEGHQQPDPVRPKGASGTELQRGMVCYSDLNDQQGSVDAEHIVVSYPLVRQQESLFCPDWSSSWESPSTLTKVHPPVPAQLVVPSPPAAATIEVDTLKFGAGEEGCSGSSNSSSLGRRVRFSATAKAITTYLDQDGLERDALDRAIKALLSDFECEGAGGDPAAKDEVDSLPESSSSFSTSREQGVSRAALVLKELR